MPRITVTVSDQLAKFLEDAASTEKRSVSAEVSLSLEKDPKFKAWLETQKASA